MLARSSQRRGLNEIVHASLASHDCQMDPFINRSFRHYFSLRDVVTQAQDTLGKSRTIMDMVQAHILCEAGNGVFDPLRVETPPFRSR